MKGRKLIIEDNPQNMYLTSFILEKSGYEVIQAETGLEGIDKAAAEQPDLILLDIQLPEMDGYETAGRLKQSDRTKGHPNRWPSPPMPWSATGKRFWRPAATVI